MADRSIKVILSAQIADFKRQMDEASKATKKVGDDAEKSSSTATTALGRMTKSALENRESWDRAGTTLTAFGAATVAALGYSAKAAIDWETAWAGVSKTVDGSDAQMAALEGSLRDLAKTLPASHQEIAAVAEAAGQLGVGIGGITDFTRTMIDLGETTNLSADEAATAIAQMANIMGLDLSGGSDDVQRFGATLVALGNDGASTEREIVMMAQRIAGSGKLVGATSGEVLGLANALASMGVTAELGGGVASRVIQDIYTAVQSGGSDLEGFARVAGMSAAQFADAFGNDPIRALGAFATGLNGVETSGGNVVSTLTDLGFRSTEEQRILLQLKASGDLLNESLDLQSQAWADNSALVNEAAKRYDTTASKIQVAKNNVQDAAITIGEAFLPAIQGASEGVSSFAQVVGGLPDPLLRVGAGMTAVVGGTSLLAGGFLLLLPRALETVNALRDIGAISPRAASTLGRVGGGAAKIAGTAAALVGVAAALNEIHMASMDAIPSVEQMTASLLEAEGVEGVQRYFSGISETFDDMKGAADRAFSTDINGWADRNIGGLFGLTTATTQAEDAFEAYGSALATIYESNPEEAERRFAAAMDETGRSREELLGLMGPYADALAAADVQQQLAGDSATGLAGGMDEVSAATAEADEELQKWLEDVASTDAAFVSAFGAYDTLVQKNRDVAQATADATESSEDSWETFYDGFSVSTEEYLAELQRQVDAQSAWETNLLLLSGRASQGVIDELYSMGAEGAPLVAQLVNASDEELARMETLFGQRSETATGAFASTLNSSAPVIAAAAAQLGEGAAAEIAAKLASGTYTVEQIMAEYGLKIEGIDPTVTVNADTADATNKLDSVLTKIQRLDGRIVTTNLVTNEKTYRSTENTSAPVARAWGGPVFGPGTETSDSIAARLSHNEHVWSAAEVKGAGGHAAVASMRAAARTGSLPGSLAGFRNGGSPGFSASSVLAPAPVVSLDGMRLTGRIDMGDGLTGLIDARVNAGLSQQARAAAGSRSTAGVVR
jgi:TP901 family phage tail tape measure protein